MVIVGPVCRLGMDVTARFHQANDRHGGRWLDSQCDTTQHPEPARDYYSIAEFAKLVEKSQYTVREWCRLQRINAEKCETGRGDAKSWKISSDEVKRYRNHGLLPATYLR